MGFFDSLNQLSQNIGGALDDVSGVLGKIGKAKGQFDQLSIDVPDVDLGSVLGQLGIGGGGGFGPGVVNHANQDTGPTDYPKTWTDEEGRTWTQEHPSVPPRLIFEDPPLPPEVVAARQNEKLLVLGGVAALAFLILR